MMRRRAVSSTRRPSAWLVVAGGLVLYGTAVVILALARISPTLLLPWWIAQAVPPIAYAVLIRVSVRPASVSRWIAGTALLWAAHVLLGVLTAGVVASMGAWSVDLSGVEAFPPPLIPEILWVPLLLIPLRDSIVGHRRAITGRRVRNREIDGGARDGAAATLVRQSPATATERVAPASSDVKWPQRSSRDTEGGPQAPTQDHPTARAATIQAPNQMPSRGAPAKRIAEPSPPRLDEMAGEGTLNASMRISFDRIAGQFPAGAFNVPLDQVNASLADPGRLSIPSRVVLAQLAEGLVHARWDVIAPQIPERLLAVTREEMAEQLTEGRLILPLDELVPQVPLDLLMPEGKPVVVDGIERFPAPFQSTAGLDVPVLGEAESSGEWSASPSEWPLVDETDAGDEAADLPVFEDVEIDETLTGLAGIEPQATSEAPGVAMQPQETVDLCAAGARSPSGFPAPPDEIAEMSAPPASRPEPVPPVRTPVHMETVSNGAAGLPLILNDLDAAMSSVDGIKILASSSSSLGVGAAVAATKLLLPVLGAARGAWTMNQMTLRGRDGALILTPLGSVVGVGSVLVSAVPLGGSLALAEMASLRAAASTPVVADHARGEAPDDKREADLFETEPLPAVHRIAATLDALGSIVATTLRVRETGRDIHLFLPPDSDAQAVARLAGEIDHAVRAVARLGSLFHTAGLRCGARRLIVRLDRRDAADSSIIIVGGETGRPGLACRQAEDAALALGVR